MQMSVKNRSVSLPMTALTSVLLLVSALNAQSQSPEARSGQWRTAGQNLSNTWSQPAEHSISPTTQRPETKMAVHNRWRCFCYSYRGWRRSLFPRLGGNLFAVDKNSGRAIWSHKISDTMVSTELSLV